MRKNIALLIFFFFSLCKLNAQSTLFKQQLDSIQELRLLSKNEDLDIDIRITLAKKASELSHKMGVDSVGVVTFIRT
ncbi:hypothetical protein [Snuella lapsa]|uniref:TolC family protein n=1 Tax=Snuella lapsa TaxID=870481 RepID=A0ABP6YMF1_9FLAO